jgi:hypothetical protein
VPVKAYSVSSLIVVQKMGQGDLAIPSMKSGGWAEVGWMRALNTGARHGLSNKSCSQVENASRRAMSRRAVMEGAVRATWPWAAVATSTAMS